MNERLKEQFCIEAIVEMYRALEEARPFVESVRDIWLHNAARFAESGKRSVLCRDGAEHLMKCYHNAARCLDTIGKAKAAYEVSIALKIEGIKEEYEKQLKESEVKHEDA